MNLIEHLFPSGLPADLDGWLIVMPPSAAATLVTMQDQLGAMRFRVQPIPLSDGRCFIPAMVLAEAHPSGLYPHIGWITPEMLDGVEVAPLAEIAPFFTTLPETPA